MFDYSFFVEILPIIVEILKKNRQHSGKLSKSLYPIFEELLSSYIRNLYIKSIIPLRKYYPEYYDKCLQGLLNKEIPELLLVMKEFDYISPETLQIYNVYKPVFGFLAEIYRDVESNKFTDTEITDKINDYFNKLLKELDNIIEGSDDNQPNDPNGNQSNDPNGPNGNQPNGPNGNQSNDPNGNQSNDPNGNQSNDPNGNQSNDPNSCCSNSDDDKTPLSKKRKRRDKSSKPSERDRFR